MRPGLAAAFAFVVALAFPRPASAEEVTLRYAAPKACPSASAFEAAVQHLSSRIVFPAASGPQRHAQTVLVLITERGPDVVGDVVVSGKAPRTVEGKTCAEVVEALALVTALAIDPTAHPNAAPHAHASSPPPPPPEAPTMPPPPERVMPAPPAARVIPDVPTAAEPPQDAPATVWPSPSELDADVGLTLRTGIAPASLLGIAAGATVRSKADQLYAPELSLAFAYGTSGPFDAASANATYKLFAAQLTACPIRVLHAGRLSLYPCAGTDLGVVMAMGESPLLAKRGQAAPFWADLTLTGRGVVDLVGQVFLRVDAGVAASILQPSFVFVLPERNVSYVSGAGFVASLGVGARFW